MTSGKPTESTPAHPDSEGRVSKIASVRTKKAAAADATVEFRLPVSLKEAAQEKAKIDRSTLSKVLVNCLRDYVAGDVLGQKVLPSGRKARRAQLAEIRRIHAEQLALLRDLMVLAQQPSSSLSAPACSSMLKEILLTVRASFRLLHRNVS